MKPGEALTIGLIRPGREMVGCSELPGRVRVAGRQRRGRRHAAESTMLAIGHVFRLAVFPAAVSIIVGAEAQFGEVCGEAAGGRRSECCGGAKGEPSLRQQGQDSENSRNHPASGMAVSRRKVQFGCCQRGASHVITIAGAADSG